MSNREEKDTSAGTGTSRDSDVGPLVEGVDYYLEDGLLVFTSVFLQKRGYCCESGCRHCPYGFNED